MSRYYTAIIFMSVFSMVVMGMCVLTSNTLARDKKKLFFILYATIALASLCEWLGLWLQNADIRLRWLHIAVKAVELSVAPLTGVTVGLIVRQPKRWKLLRALLILHALLECASGVFGFIYRVDGQNLYSHADFYWIYVCAYVFSGIYAMAATLSTLKKYQYSGLPFLILMVGYVVAGLTVQFFENSLHLDWLTLSVTGILLYIFNSEMVQQTDALTQLINRRGYETILGRVQGRVAILFFDVDKFKEVNDNYGHVYGDHCLKTIGECIWDVYGRWGKCFRIGGDEFCVVLERNLEGVEEMNTALFRRLGDERARDGHLPFVSVGYVHYDPSNCSVRDAVKEADAMMYEYKARNRNRSG